jgi:4a-hydroxytetrahydrobiopterin dehydratase
MLERKLLDADQLASAVAGLKGWETDQKMIKRRFEFPNFAESLAFVNRVGELAEAADHHPDITLGWGYAEIALTTHDRGGVTDVDVSLASHIDRLE